MKCVVLFLCSSGARIGSVGYLRWKDVEEVDADGQIFATMTIYMGEPEEYITFITPECYRYLLQYKELREKIGEKVAPSSFVFTTEANKTDFDPSKVKPVTVKTLKNLLGKRFKQLGLRSVLTEHENYTSYEFKQAHGFRKFFKTRIEVSGVKPLVIETLMGHSTGISSSTAGELAQEYAKAMDGLTIIKTKEAVDQNTVIATFNKQYLAMAGYMEEEIASLRDLSKLSLQALPVLSSTPVGVNQLQNLLQPVEDAHA